MPPTYLFRYIAVVVLLSTALLCLTAQASDVACGFTTQRVQCGDLGCDKDKQICIACRSDNDCYPSGMYCDAGSGECKVKGIGSTFGFLTFCAMAGAVIVCSVAVIAGVGGGGILVPMFCGFMSIPMQTAVGLSQSTICGQSTLNMWLAVQKKFPDPTWDRPLINYQYLSLMLPLGLIGTLIGGILSKLCPDILRLVLLFVLLSAVLYRTIGKMKAQYAADKEAHRVTVESGDGTAAVSASPTQRDYGSGKEEGSAEPSTTAGSPQPMESEGGSPLRPPQPQYPKKELVMAFGSFFTLLIFNILRTYTSCGGALYWLCVVCPLVLLSAVFYYTREELRKVSESAPEMLTFEWNERNSVTYPMVAVVAGAAAAMLGIGGGLVLGFVLYEVGLIPMEASVTGGMATFFIAFSSALQLLVTGHLAVDYGCVFFLVGLASTALGQSVFMKYIKDHGLSYLIVGSLALVVGGSLVVLGGYGIYNAVNTSKTGGSVMAFGRLCNR